MSDDFPSQKSPWRVQGVSSPPCLITMKGIIMDQHTQQVLSSNGPIAWPDCDPGRLDIWPAQLGFKGLVARTIREFKPFMCMYLYIYIHMCVYTYSIISKSAEPMGCPKMMHFTAHVLRPWENEVGTAGC